MRISERLGGSASYQEAIRTVQIDERLTVMRRLDKPGQWFVIDLSGERLGILTAASQTAKKLNGGEHLVHARVVGIIQSGDLLLVRAEFLLQL